MELERTINLLFENISKGYYPALLLDNPEELFNKITKDLDCTDDRAKEILGYLLKHHYVKIDPINGIVPIKA